MTRAARAALLLAAVACARQEGAAKSTAADTVASAAVVEPLPTDTLATIQAFEARVAQIERDTTLMDQLQKPISLGAGTDALLTAWRAGPVWKRLRVEASGSGFHSVDDYWLSDGVFLGARLAMIRDGRKPSIEQVWFRNQRLYRWTDAAGRHPNPDARSTQYEVQMLRARLDTLLHRLDADDAVRRPPR